MSWTRRRGFYGWAPLRERFPARVRLAYANGLSWPAAVIFTLRAELRR